MTRLTHWLRQPARPSIRRNPLTVTQLEDRVVPAGRPLPMPVIYVGAGRGRLRW